MGDASLKEIQFSAITVMSELSADKGIAETQTAGLGGKIPRVYGRVITPGNIFWLKNNTLETLTLNDEDLKFGTFALGLCIGEAYAVTRIWAGNKRIFNIITDSVNNMQRPGFENSGCYTGKSRIGFFELIFQFYPGTLTQPRCPIMVDADGEEFTPRYPSLSYIVFSNFPLHTYNNAIENLDLRVEVVKTLVFTPEALAIFDATVDEIPLTEKIDIDNCIIALKSRGYFQRLDRLYVGKKAVSEQMALLNWKDPSISMTKHGAASWTTTDGFASTGANAAYFNTNFTPSTDGVNFTLNSASYLCYVTGKATSGSYFGKSGSPTNTNSYMKVGGTDSLSATLNSANSKSSGNNVNSTGFFAVCRTASNAWRLDKNGVSAITHSGASGALPTASIYLLAERTVSGDGTINECNGKIAVWAAGDEFSLAEELEIKEIFDSYFAA